MDAIPIVSFVCNLLKKPIAHYNRPRLYFDPKASYHIATTNPCHSLVLEPQRQPAYSATEMSDSLQMLRSMMQRMFSTGTNADVGDQA